MKCAKGPKKKSKADFSDDNKKGLSESGKGSWHYQPKEETNKTQAGARSVKIAGPMRKTSLKWNTSEKVLCNLNTNKYCKRLQ